MLFVVASTFCWILGLVPLCSYYLILYSDTLPGMWQAVFILEFLSTDFGILLFRICFFLFKILN